MDEFIASYLELIVATRAAECYLRKADIRSRVMPDTIERRVCDVDGGKADFGFGMLAAEVDFGSCDGLAATEVVLGLDAPDRVTAVFFCNLPTWLEPAKAVDGLGRSCFPAVARGLLAAASDDLE